MHSLRLWETQMSECSESITGWDGEELFGVLQGRMTRSQGMKLQVTF